MTRGSNSVCVLDVSPRRRFSILMISEFFYPDVGGIETHIYALSTKLIEQGHRVAVVTRNFGDRSGIRYMSNGMKVYHLPTVFCVRPCGYPMFVDSFPIARCIIIREQVDIIHYHQTSSKYGFVFAHVGYIMGCRSVFTDHSLFSFTEPGPIALNEALRHNSALIDHSICVSNTHKENLALRTEFDPRDISVIGNAIDASCFTPAERKRNDNRIVIVVVSRLTIKKGIDLLNDVISIVCQRHKNVDFVIGGDGPLYSSIVEMIDKLYLHNRVTLLGAVPTYKVNDVLKQGDIFLNTSRSESFCIAILEAASSGLLCVSTNVGGVHEILPRDMVLLANYTPESLANRIDEAILMLPKVDRQTLHRRVKEMYSWNKVASEVNLIYEKIVRRKKRRIFDLICSYWDLSTCFKGYLLCMLIVMHIEWIILELIYPRSSIDIAPDWSAKCWTRNTATKKTGKKDRRASTSKDAC